MLKCVLYALNVFHQFQTKSEIHTVNNNKYGAACTSVLNKILVQSSILPRAFKLNT